MHEKGLQSFDELVKVMIVLCRFHDGSFFFRCCVTLFAVGIQYAYVHSHISYTQTISNHAFKSVCRMSTTCVCTRVHTSIFHQPYNEIDLSEEREKEKIQIEKSSIVFRRNENYATL